MSESENVSKNATPQEETKKETTSVEDKYTWMVRPCEIYKDEYNDCTSIRARFHQYFVFGEPINCKQWNTDYKNCKKWNTYKSKEAYVS
ncbi:UPF0545 protein C22orf39 like protein [Habropoda laboriosa]|uniref:Synaptic plasticity regulator PANTS n=1 Tax=Habropoda laboriosa TaxID=597456 RepID=A0A0L7R171_9HYME|nr:UPF0545 protein C22orf39 like protein [Habropoda laboriosa]